MALQRLTIDGCGQLELNNAAFRRDGRIEAQCALDATDFAEVPAENGMVFAVNKAARTVKFWDGTSDYPLAINYSAEHLYDERKQGLKDFSLTLNDFYPRLGYLSVGDTYTTNTICYDTAEFTDDDALVAAAETVETTPLYAGLVADCKGAWKVTATKPTAGPVALVVKSTTMPDGQYAVKLHVLAD